MFGWFTDAEGRIGRTQVFVAIGVVVVLGVVILLFTMSFGKKSARSELPEVVNAIRQFELDYYGPFGEYVSAEPAPRAPHAVNGEAVMWASNAGFDKLGFAPEGRDEMVGSYRVAATATGFTVTGTCDLDEDGERAVFVATEKEEARAVSDPSVY